MSVIQKLLSSDVRKPTALVHFEREMSSVEQKLMTIIIFHCQLKNKDQNGFYFIKKSFIREFLGWEVSNNYPRIYEGFDRIYDNSIKWNFLEADRTFKSLRCKLIVSLLEPSETGHYIGFKLHPDLEPLIQDPKLFAKIKFIMMSILAKPKYAFALYEILSDFYSRGQETVKVPLSVLRQSLGIPQNSYQNFVPFKKRVLNPNLDAINQNTDCCVKYSTYREGRKIAGVTFRIQKQRWQPPLLLNHFNELKEYYQQTLPLEAPLEQPLSPEEIAFVKDISHFGITEGDARAAIKAHGLQGAIEIRDYVIERVEHRKDTDKKVKDVGAYMAYCLHQGFGKKSEEERKRKDNERIVKEVKEKECIAREVAEKEAKQLKKRFWSYQTQLIDERLAQMNDIERSAFDQKFLNTNVIWKKRFHESGLTTPMVRSVFYSYAIKELLSDNEQDITVFATKNCVAPEVITFIQK